MTRNVNQAGIPIVILLKLLLNFDHPMIFAMVLPIFLLEKLDFCVE
ncbi:hypothetical protein GGR43_002267 [Sphingobium jiangsuense]|uniref:Uncharacterized protein n=1 Tax=Sphingobium jiangsuense TaxID=870476 RepID=A0A7W6FQC8_9SPHN|nr:hypothetical protein [Sphingobium jiangsuense]